MYHKPVRTHSTATINTGSVPPKYVPTVIPCGVLPTSLYPFYCFYVHSVNQTSPNPLYSPLFTQCTTNQFKPCTATMYTGSVLYQPVWAHCTSSVYTGSILPTSLYLFYTGCFYLFSLKIILQDKERLSSSGALTLTYEGTNRAILRNPEFYEHREVENKNRIKVIKSIFYR